MYKISEFARLGGVSAKMLRHYDELGLLRPVATDPATGYRYYSAEQLPRLNRIVVLKELGFTLQQIGPLLDDRISAERLAGMLALRQAEAEQRLDHERRRLARIAARLAQIAQEGCQPRYEVLLRPIAPIRAASCTACVASEAALPALREQIERFLLRRRVAAAGPPIVLYHACDDSDLEVEVAVPINAAVAGDGGVQVGELPAAPVMACAIHSGLELEAGMAYAALARWVEAAGYRIEGACREVYVQGGLSAAPGEHIVMEIQFPVVQRADAQFPAESCDPQITQIWLTPGDTSSVPSV